MFAKLAAKVVIPSLLFSSQWTRAIAQTHGEGAEGTVMGPVAFLWPSDRTWNSQADNVGPCGSNSGVTNRTKFPISQTSSIELTIADEAYNVALRISYDNNPTTQDDFDSVQNNVTEIIPGHQCYTLPQTSLATEGLVTSGTNATIQLEYWGNDSNKNESFFACADITFVDAATFTTQVPCFNVTSEEFEAPAESTSSASPSATSSPAVPASSSSPSSSASPAAEKHKGSDGLSAGAKAGIAIGSIIGAAIFIAFGFFFFIILRNRNKRKGDAEGVQLDDRAKKGSASFASGETPR